MGYNLSRAVVVRMRRFLDDLSLGRTTTWPSRNPARLARQIREALHASGHHPEFEQFYELKNFYKIRIHPRYVEAEWVGEEEEERESVWKQEQEVQEVQETTELRMTDITDLDGVVGAAIMNPGHNLYFPNAILTEDEIGIIQAWDKENRWIVIAHTEAGLTLQRRESR